MERNSLIPDRVKRRLIALEARLAVRWNRIARDRVARRYHYDLIYRTANFDTTTWLGTPIWQNVLDAWTIQETIAEVRPALLIETGTHKGGSAMFYANLMDLLDHGRMITIDIVEPEHLEHPRVSFLHGSSTDPGIVAQVREAAAEADGPVMVILDGLHDRDHVAQELELYGPLVTPDSYLMSQDGVIDTLRMFRDSRPGPLDANRDFLARHPEFEHDHRRNDMYGLTHHPLGWMRRRP